MSGVLSFLQLKQQSVSGSTQYIRLLAMAAAIIPLWIAPGIYLHFDTTPKVLLVVAVAVIGLLSPRAWSGACAALWRDPFGRGFLIVFAAQILSLLLSTLFSAEPPLSIAGTNWRRFGLIPQVATVVFAVTLSALAAVNRDGLRLFMRAATFGGLLAAVYGIFQYFGIDPLLDPEWYHIGEGEWEIVRTPGTMGHAGYFATYLVVIVFWATYLARIEESQGWRLLGYAAAAAAAFAVILSGTRGAMLGLLTGVIAATSLHGFRIHRRAVIAALLAVAALAVFYVSPPGEKLRGRTRWYIEDATGGGRLLLWRDSLDMFITGPWIAGTGLETFGAKFPRFLSDGLASQYPNRYYESPHNIFMDALTSQGIMGFLVLAAMAVVALRAMSRLKVSNVPGGGFLAAAFIAILFSHQFLAFTLPTALFFYLALGVLVVASLPILAAERPPQWIWIPALPAGLAAIVFLIQLAAVEWLPLSARRDIESGKVAEAIQARLAMPILESWGFTPDLFFSRLMLGAAQKSKTIEERTIAIKAATEFAERAAVRADERQSACYNLAIVYGLQDDARRAEAALRQTIEVAPAWYKPRWMLAQVLHATGRVQEAFVQAERAATLNRGADPEVTATRDQLRALAMSAP